MLLWVPDPATRDATLVRQALMGDVIDLRAATEVLCSRTPAMIQTIKQTYLARFGSYLEHDIQRLASGDHEKVRIVPPSSSSSVTQTNTHHCETSFFVWNMEASMYIQGRGRSMYIQGRGRCAHTCIGEISLV